MSRGAYNTLSNSKIVVDVLVFRIEKYLWMLDRVGRILVTVRIETGKIKILDGYSPSSQRWYSFAAFVRPPKKVSLGFRGSVSSRF